MSSQHDFSRSFPVNAAITAYRRVTVSSNGSVDVATWNTLGHGVIQQDAGGYTYETPKVRFYGTGSVRVAATAVPITAGNVLYAVTNGMVAPTNGATGGVTFGYALESASSNGDVIEVLPVF